MDIYEYKVVPAPTKGKKERGVKTPEDRFSNSVQSLMNEMALDGWEFQRSEALPHEHRAGLTGRTTTMRHILVFRRPANLVEAEAAEDGPKLQSEGGEPALVPGQPPLTATGDAALTAAAPRPETRDKFFAGGKFLDQKPKRRSMKSLLRKHLREDETNATPPTDGS